MARYIYCEKCNKRMAVTARNFDEFYESIEGVALKDMLCDGSCGTHDGATEIKKGDKCFASVLLNSSLNPVYAVQNPKLWAHEYIKY